MDAGGFGFQASDFRFVGPGAAAAVVLAVWVAAGTAFGKPGFLQTLGDSDANLHGFLAYRCGVRTGDDPFEDDVSLNELRLQLDAMAYHDLVTGQLKADLLFDERAEDRNDIDLENGRGFLDLRQANLLCSPLSWVDVKAGRQILTWGTGDLLFINDLFPKDWQAFFLGRDETYLKAPSDAVLVSLFPEFAGIDIAYTPRFDADRHITGERLSYWTGSEIAGRNAVVAADRPDEWFDDDEIAVRVYRNVGGIETAAYFYDGFWKSPGGMDPRSRRATFPNLTVIGGSVRGPLGKGIMNVELGYYDSRGDRDGSDPFVNNSEARALAGYEREMAKNLTVGVQYYLEAMLDHDEYLDALARIGVGTDPAREQHRHTLTLRLTCLMLNQNLVLSCFTRYSPSEKDVYVKPAATYKLSDRWQTGVGGNIFAGRDDHTFLGQFENNSNVHASLRCSF